MQVVITLAGQGTRFSEKGYLEPKPAVLAGGRPVIVYLIESFSKDASLFFVIGEHFRNSNLETVIKEAAPSAEVIYTPFSSRGPIDTCRAALPFLDPEQSVLTSYCDLALVWDHADFIKAVAGYDMALVNYQGFHPTYFGPNSYCHVSVSKEDQTVISVQEKKLYTDAIEKEITSAGLYYFKNARLFAEALDLQLQQNLKYGEEFYISLAVQAMQNRKSDLRILDYRVDYVVQFGTPQDVDRFEFWYQMLVLKKLTSKMAIEKFEQEKKYWTDVFTSKQFQLGQNN